MRLTVDLGGRRTAVVVSDDLASVRVGDRSYPVRVVARGTSRVELEIGGETAVVESWPEGAPSPPGPVDVNGERWIASVQADAGSAPAPSTAAPGPPPTAGAPAAGGGTPVVPPMPGRVVEVRVRNGQAVVKGTVLLVLEAMKMRNEVTAPVDGVVADLKVEEGTSVRARETMLVLRPPT